MPSMTTCICGNSSCKKEFKARTADVNRGWGKFCSKRCKATDQERRTHQYAKLLRQDPPPQQITNRLRTIIEAKCDHPFASDSIGQY